MSLKHRVFLNYFPNNSCWLHHRKASVGDKLRNVSFLLHEMSFSGFATAAAVVPECQGLPSLPGGGAIVD